MSIVRRAMPVAAALAALALGACSSNNSDSTASSTPATAPSSVASTPASTDAPGTTAVGAPVPIGGATTVAGDPASASSTVPGDTSPSGTDAGQTTTPAATDGGSSTTAGPTAGSTTTPTSPPPVTPSPNANTAFCEFEAKVQQASDDAEDDAAFLAALAQLYPDMQQWVMSAPDNTLRQAAVTLRDATKASIDAGNLDPLDTEDATEALLDIELSCKSPDPA